MYIKILTLLLIALLVPSLNGCGGGDADAQGVVTPPLTPPFPIGTTITGAPFVSALDPRGVGWTGCVSYEPGRDGGGCFFQFISQNKAGVYMAGVNLNGGLIDATPGKEQGDLDIGLIIDGKPAVIAFSGGWAGQPAGIMPWPSELFSIGGPNNKWTGLWIKEEPCPPSVPGNPSGCIKVNGGFSPIYR